MLENLTNCFIIRFFVVVVIFVLEEKTKKGGKICVIFKATYARLKVASGQFVTIVSGKNIKKVFLFSVFLFSYNKFNKIIYKNFAHV